MAARKPITYRAVTPHGTFEYKSTRPIAVLGLGICKRPARDDTGRHISGGPMLDTVCEAWSKHAAAAENGWCGLVKYLGTYPVEIVS